MIRTDVVIGSKSVPGYRHRVEGRENEDAAFVSGEHPFFDAVMIVADGMGGHPEPGRAARTAVAAAREFLFAPERLKELRGRSADPTDLLQRAVQHANGMVRRLAVEPQPTARSVAAAPTAAEWTDDKPPGCTLILAVILDGQLGVANVGDGSVFLFRDRRLLPLAGGEARRLGSRPEQFLGRGDRVDIESVTDRIHSGDRVLLCTDGLTRYFGSGSAATGGRTTGAGGSESLDRLQQIVGRVSADPQALASQLTADGRGELYDDDTTVLVADVGVSRELPDPQPERERRSEEQQRMEAAPRQPVSSAPSRTGVVTAGMVVSLIVGVAIGTWHPWSRTPGERLPVFQPAGSPPVDLSMFPRGGVVLAQRGTSRIYVLRTRPVGTPPPDEPLKLSELRVLPGKGLKDTRNTYTLDASRGRLIDPNGHTYPVTVDGTTGVIQVQQSGTLHLTTKTAGLPVFIDGRYAGPTPLSIKVPAGRHQLQVRAASGGGVVWDLPVEILPGVSVKLSQDTPAVSGGRVTRP
jgi:serine/threonine protein phosphatase PrpC